MKEFYKDTKVIILGILSAIGILISIGFNIKDAIEIGNVGLPTPAWTAIGLVIFFTCFFELLYLWRKHMLSSPTKQAEISLDKTSLPNVLTQEQIAERSAFIRRAKAVSEQLSQTIQYSYGVSLIRFFVDISQDSRVQNRLQEDQVMNQVFRLIKHDLDILSSSVSTHESRVNTFDTNVSDEQIHSICIDVVKLFHEIARLMGEIFKVIEDLGMKGNIPAWEDIWQNRMKRDLGATYDELIRLLKDMRSETPEQFRNLIPRASDFSNFSNTFKVPWE